MSYFEDYEGRVNMLEALSNPKSLNSIAKDAFEVADKDSNGYIDKEEFERLDIDKNGIIDFEEFKKYVKEIVEKILSLEEN